MQTKELEELIYFWKDNLTEPRLLMIPPTVYLVEQTIKRLEELKQTKEVQDVPNQRTHREPTPY